MEIRFVLKRQYRAALAMLRECVELASPEVWTYGPHPRCFWRIAYHGAFFAHLYLGQTEADYVPWELHRESVTDLWQESNPPVVEPYSKEQLLSYIDHVNALIDPTVDKLDLDCQETGFHWYKDMGKLEHEILSVRHIQTHVGQLSELLMAAGVQNNFWISKA